MSNWRCTIKRKITLSFLSFILILALVITPIACVTKKPGTDSVPSSTDANRITALESKVKQLESKLASLPTSSGNYDGDIEALQADIDILYTELDDILMDVYDMLDEWEQEQASTNTNGTDANSTDATDATTRWSLDVWTDYDSYNLLDIDLDSKRIEDGDDYTIWLLLYNANIKSSYLGEYSTEPSTPTVGDYYYNTGTKTMYRYTDIWIADNSSSIYQPVEIKEITIQFSSKSSDRVAVDESQTELYSTGYPSFDWDMDFNNKINGTCKRMEATTETRFTIPVPTRFINNDPEKPYPEEFKLEFELAYKQ